MTFLIISMLLLAYILPAYVAFMRRHRNAPAICVLTLLRGWTFFGWCVAMVWAMTSDVNNTRS
jgi:ABC-type transport system involved in cytochrome c biogenesis permease component